MCSSDLLILLPICIYFILKLIPEPLLTQCRAEAEAWSAAHKPKPRSIIAAVVIMVLWMLFFGAVWKYWGDDLLKWWRAP